MVWLSEAMSLGDLLVRAAERDPSHDALVFPDVRRTYGELQDRAMARGRSLIALGVRPMDHVGILMPNHVDLTEVMFGASLIGAIPVPINARFKERELAYVVNDAELAVLVTTDVIAEHVDYVELLHAAIPGLSEAVDPAALDHEGCPSLRSVVCLGSDESYPGMLSKSAFEALADTVDSAEVEQRRLRVRLRDTCTMIYTSGTTADPKGCPLSHEALVRTGRATADRFRLTPADVFWDPLPMFHMSSILPITATIDAGASFVTLTHFSVDAAIDQFLVEKPTVAYTSFPTVAAGLIAHPRWSEVDVGRIRLTVNVAPEDLLRRFQRAFPHAIQVAAYGLSEVTGVIGYNELTDTLEQRVTTCGRPFPGLQVKVVDPETLEPVPPGTKGEIWAKGYSLFQGYWKDPQKQAESVTEDGWLRTGDICSVDADGRISYHGRLKDMLKVGGENVAAVEIESFLANHPAVKLAQIVGMPDDKYDEVPAAFVELQQGATTTEEELIEFCRGKIASFKIPRKVVFTDDWPMSATKIQKFRLRQRLLDGEG